MKNSVYQSVVKVINWLLVAFLIVSAVNALQQSDFWRYYAMDDNSTSSLIDETGNNLNGTIYFGVIQRAGKVGNSFDFHTTDSYANLGILNLSGNLCMGFWLRDLQQTAGYSLFGGADADNTARMRLIYQGNQLDWGGNSDSGGWTFADTSTNIASGGGGWTHYVVSKNSTHITSWTNGTLTKSETPANYGAECALTDRAVVINGKREQAGSGYEPEQFEADEWFFIQAPCTSADVTQIWNGGAGTSWADFAAPSADTFDLKFLYSVNELFYSNKSFDEAEHIIGWLNLTNNSVQVTDDTCTMDFINATKEVYGQNYITICNSGCSYDIYPFTTALETISAYNDYIRMWICHNGTVSNQDLDVDVLCGAKSYSHTISAAEFVDCLDGETPITLNITYCSDEDLIGVNITNNAVQASKHSINAFEYHREFGYARLNTTWNTTNSLYRTDSHVEYYIHGGYPVFGNCTIPHNESDTITIGNVLPVITHLNIGLGSNITKFTNLIEITLLNTTPIDFYVNILSNDLQNHTDSVYNTTHLIWNTTTVGGEGSYSVTLPAGLVADGMTYNFTTVARDLENTSSKTTKFVVNIVENQAPSITLLNTDGELRNIDENWFISYVPNDEGTINNCSLYTNISSTWQETSFDDSINLAVTNTFNMSVSSAGRYMYGIGCIDNFNVTGYSVNQSFVIAALTGGNIYNLTNMDSTKFFNTEALDLGTTAGVILWIFILLVVGGMIAFAEISQIPIFGILASFSIIAFGALIYSALTGIIGLFVIFMGVFYLARAFFMAR